MTKATTETVDMENPLNKWLLRQDVKTEEFLIPENTRRSYRYWVLRLFKILRTDEVKFLKNTRQHRSEEGNIDDVWKELKDAGDKLPQSGKRIALNAVRAYLRFSGIFPPADHADKIQKKTLSGYFDIYEAAKIIQAAEQPYREIFRIMVRGVMGAREFLMFNTENTWAKAKNLPEIPDNSSYELKKSLEITVRNTETLNTALDIQNILKKSSMESPKPYLRVDYSYRKSSNIPYYTLIPVKILKEILKTHVEIPLQTEKGVLLDMTHYLNCVKYLDAAFHRAVIRSEIQTEQPARLHQLRDMIATLGTDGFDPPISDKALEFVMGHPSKIDSNGYNQCWRSPDWVWRQLSRLHPVLDQVGL